MAVLPSIHVGDVNTELVVAMADEQGVPIDVSAAAVRTIRLRKPAGTVLSKTAVNDTTGTNGLIRYDTIAGDLDAAGWWSIQGYVEVAAGKWSSMETRFWVAPVLA